MEALTARIAARFLIGTAALLGAAVAVSAPPRLVVEAPPSLAAYARGRQPDRWGGALFTDGIVRAFSNDLPPLRALRGLGLLALDAAPPLRRFIARRMIWGARAWF